MPKTTKFSELRAQMSPEARAEARRLADEDLKEMPLHELRAARHVTQQQLATIRRKNHFPKNRLKIDCSPHRERQKGPVGIIPQGLCRF